MFSYLPFNCFFFPIISVIFVWFLAWRLPLYQRLFWPPKTFYFDMCLTCFIQQACLWSCLMLFKLKSTKMKSGWRGMERVICHGNIIYYSRRCAACRTISLPSFNGLCCKLTEIALFILGVGCMTSSVLLFAYFIHFSNLNIFGTYADISKR